MNEITYMFAPEDNLWYVDYSSTKISSAECLQIFIRVLLEDETIETRIQYLIKTKPGITFIVDQSTVFENAQDAADALNQYLSLTTTFTCAINTLL